MKLLGTFSGRDVGLHPRLWDSILWTQIPKMATGLSTSNIPETDLGSYLGLYVGSAVP